MDQEEQFYDAFLKQARQLKRFGGSVYIWELWQHPETRISPVQLYTLYQGNSEENLAEPMDGFYYPEIDTVIYKPPELPIEVMDKRAIREITAALKALRYELQKESARRNHAQADDLRDQIEFLENHIRSAVTPSGKSRTMGNITKDHYLLVYRKVQAFLKAVEKHDPELADYLRSHVVIASQCYWSEAPLKARQRKSKASNLSEEPIVCSEKQKKLGDGQRPA